MAPEKTKVKDYDQFQLRLPPGMRERIKAKAERAEMSMNEAIVWCLEKYFPAPATLEERVEGLATAVAALKRGSDLEAKIDEIVDQIDKTLRDIADDKIPVSVGFAEKVAKRVEEWDLDDLEELQDRPFDDDLYSKPYLYDDSIGDPFEDNPAPTADDKQND